MTGIAYVSVNIVDFEVYRGALLKVMTGTLLIFFHVGLLGLDNLQNTVYYVTGSMTRLLCRCSNVNKQQNLRVSRKHVIGSVVYLMAK